MKVLNAIVLAVMIATCCVAVEEIKNDALNHVVIPSGQKGVVYQWKQKSQGFAHAEACYGRRINVYQKATPDINPETDKVYANFTNEIPILILPLTSNWYIGFFAVDTDNKGPNGINGAVDFVVSTDEDKMNDLIPKIPSKLVEMKLSLNSGTATLSWDSTGHDKTTIYRKDIKMKDYNKDKDFPPSAYYMTGCSAKLWLTVDTQATDAVKIQRHDDKVTGIVQLNGIKDDLITIAAVTTTKDSSDSFIAAYDFVALGAASTTIVSVAALLVLLVSVLII